MKSATALAWLISTAAPPAAGAESAGPAVVISRDAIQPQIAVGAGGSVYAVFLHGGNVCVSTSSDQGKTFSAPSVAIDVKGRAQGGAQRGPRIGADAKQNITVTAPVVFDEAEYAKKYPTAELYLVTSSDGGKTWTEPLRVNEAPKKAPESLHWMAVAPSGEACVAWLDLRGRIDPGQDLYYARVAGGKAGKNVKIASQVCECCAPGLAVGGNGSAVLAWREGGKQTGRDLWISTARGGAGFSRPVRLNRAATNVFG